MRRMAVVCLMWHADGNGGTASALRDTKIRHMPRYPISHKGGIPPLCRCLYRAMQSWKISLNEKGRETPGVSACSGTYIPQTMP